MTKPVERDYVRRTVDNAPPLTEEQRGKLSAVFREGGPKRLDEVPASVLTPDAIRRLVSLLAPGPLNASEINSDPLDVRL